MDRDDFIITVYCLVCDYYQMIKEQFKIRRGGFAPVLTDQEVIVIELCGEYFKICKILAHTVGVFLNLLAGRRPLDLDALLA